MHYHRIKTILAKQLEETEIVETLEGEITCRAGDYLCVGSLGDVWAQREAPLQKKYIPAPVKMKNSEGWQKFLPNPDDTGVMAASIDQAFAIEHPRWGRLEGEAGDYILKRYEDRDAEFPEEVWIVNQDIFEVSYIRTEDL